MCSPARDCRYPSGFSAVTRRPSGGRAAFRDGGAVRFCLWNHFGGQSEWCAETAFDITGREVRSMNWLTVPVAFAASSFEVYALISTDPGRLTVTGMRPPALGEQKSVCVAMRFVCREAVDRGTGRMERAFGPWQIKPVTGLHDAVPLKVLSSAFDIRYARLITAPSTRVDAFGASRSRARRTLPIV
jgi:hypothetical protein